MWRLKIAALYAVIVVLAVTWFAGPGFVIGMWISGWHLVGWSLRNWIGGVVGVLINIGWARLTNRWVADRMGKKLDRAVDWAVR
jgi:hypothetical protein